ncbi:hypothetical protein SAMN06309944_0922 [Micrococcales bacterium KH10]|nr:hypothetical protein SAMN06309944_0922 [Micrococcales bacterium KH10]
MTGMEWLGTVAIWVGTAIGLIVVLVIAIRLFAQPDENGTSGGGGIFGGIDEAFNPAQHNANLELERQRRTPIEAPVPGDRKWESDALKMEYSADGTPLSIVVRPTAKNKPQDKPEAG